MTEYEESKQRIDDYNEMLMKYKYCKSEENANALLRNFNLLTEEEQSYVKLWDNQ
jgi:hypothetical protein